MKKQKYKIAGIRWISNSETGLREEYVDYLEVKGYPVTLPGYDGEGFDWFVYKTAASIGLCTRQPWASGPLPTCVLVLDAVRLRKVVQ